MEQALVYQFAICVIAASAYFGLAVPVLAAHNRELRELAICDNLTQTASRPFFFEQAEGELLRARRYQQPVVLVLFDIDHFKKINDEHGHVSGDQALKQAANAVRANLRQYDLFGRFGGDEFMLLLPGHDLIQGLEMAERLRKALNRLLIDGTQQRMSGSFGVVEVAGHESLMQAFERADRHLLCAKKAGRNQVLGAAYPSPA